MLNGARSATLQRRLKIVDLIRRHEEMRVEDLSEILGVSAVTIRSDLAYLDEQGLVLRSFGKAMAPGERVVRRDPLSRQETMAVLENCAMAIGPARHLFLGPGDLPLQLIPFLRHIAGLTLLLSRIDAVPLARQCIDGPVHLLGGQVQGDGVTLSGSGALAHVGVQLFGAAIVEIAGVGQDGTLLVGRDERDLILAACGRAQRRIGLVNATSPSESPPEQAVAFEMFDHLILAASAQTALVDLVQAQGFATSEWTGSAIALQADRQDAPPRVSA